MNPEDQDRKLAEEARDWANGALDPREWESAPGAVPRSRESVAISIRMPRKMLAVLKEFASRQGIGYQVLMKKWLDERIRQEAARVLRERRHVHLVRPKILRHAASFKAASDSDIRVRGGSDADG